MPYKDKADEKAWRKRSYTKAYMQWLYARRKLQGDKAELYEKALKTVSEMVTPEFMRTEAEEALDRAWKLERVVGNRFDHELDKPYYKEG